MNLVVSDIEKQVCRDFVSDNHYSGKCPGIKFAFGLYDSGNLVGCIVFSIPASYTLCKGVCGEDFKGNVLELSRLAITTKIKNAASFLIGNALKLLPNSIVVSYADCNSHVSHIGYVYQATNWIYTGQGSAEPLWLHPVSGEVISYTRRHIDTKALKYGLNQSDLIRKKQIGKHRYVTFCGSRNFVSSVRCKLKYSVLPYPKGITTRHDSIALKVMEPIR